MNRRTFQVIAFAVVLFAAAGTSVSQASVPSKTANAAPKTQAGPVAHPVALAADTPAATCMECHGDVAKGKYVHTALSMRCTTCHAINTKDGVTHVTLVSPANQLCETCHPLSKEKVLHGPYKEGLCVVCHSPHSSNFPDHTLAAAQDVCLGCHARARLKVNQKIKTLTTPWGKVLTTTEMQGWMYLNLNRTLTGNHPVAGHPVTGPNVESGMPPVSCQSCHKTHASRYKNLLTAGTLPNLPDCPTCGVCKQCHTDMF